MEKEQVKKLREQKSDYEDDEEGGVWRKESWKERKYDGDTAALTFHKKISCAQRNINLNTVNVPCLFRNVTAAHSSYVIIKFYLLLSHPLLSSSPCSFTCLNLSFYPKIYFLLRFLRSRGSVVSIATGYGMDDRGVGVRVPVG
jgi:hypothetical protein